MVVAPALPVQRLTFKLGSSILGLDVSDAAVRDLVESTYAPMRCEPARGSRQFTAGVRRLADGRLHAWFGRRGLPLPHAADRVPMRDAYYATREIFARFAASLPGCVAFYGAALAVDGAGVLIVGPATIGKTVLALHAAHHGARFLGDETAMLSLRGAELWAMPRKPSLRESALDWLPTDGMRISVAACPRVFDGERGRFWYALDTEDLPGIQPSLSGVPLRAVFIVSSRNEDVAIRPLTLASAVPLLVQRSYARPSELGQIAAIRRSLRHVSCFDLTLAHPHATAQAIIEQVRACV